MTDSPRDRADALPKSWEPSAVESELYQGWVDAGPAPSTVHQGAVYLHGGRQFEVEALDLSDRRAFVKPFDGDWYTQAKKETDTDIERVLATRSVLGVKLHFGTVVVSEGAVTAVPESGWVAAVWASIGWAVSTPE